MEFASTYFQAMQQQAPKLLNALIKSGKLEQHLKDKSLEARAMLASLLQNEPKGPDGRPKNLAALHQAEEATLIEFETPDSQQRPEPPDDLPQRASQIATSPAPTTRSSRDR